jgi:hypothetical protein
MKEDEIPQITFEHFIQPGNEQRKNEYRDYRTPPLLPVI